LFQLVLLDFIVSVHNVNVVTERFQLPDGCQIWQYEVGRRSGFDVVTHQPVDQAVKKLNVCAEVLAAESGLP
jgi:hypothetical protein